MPGGPAVNDDQGNVFYAARVLAKTPCLLNYFDLPF